MQAEDAVLAPDVADGAVIRVHASDGHDYNHAQRKSSLQKRDPVDPDPSYPSMSAKDASTKTMKGTSTKGRFFRGDARSPDVVFKEGFKPRGSNFNIEDHFSPGFGKPSGYVSLSRSFNVAKSFAKTNVNSITELRYIYVLTPEYIPRGYWMLDVPWKIKYAPQALDKLAEELEFAAAGDIPPEAIAGVYEKPQGTGSWKWKPNPDAATEINPSKGLSCFGRKRDLCEFMEDVEPVGTEVEGGLEGGEKELQELAVSAEKASEEEFTELMVANKLTPRVSKLKLGLKDIRARMLGYKPLRPESPALRPGKLGSMPGTSAFASAGVLAFMVIPNIALSFIRNGTAWDKAVAFTAFIPIVGCSTQLAAAIDRDQVDVADTVLCYLGDLLILGGTTAPLGILVHLARILLQAFKPGKKLPTKEEMKAKRDKPWQDLLNDKLYKSIYEGWADKLDISLALEASAVLSEGAQHIGAIKASSAVAAEAAESSENKTLIQQGADKSIQKIRHAIDREQYRKQRKYLLGLPQTILDDKTESLRQMAAKYNKDFCDSIISFDNFKQYAKPSMWKDFETWQELHGENEKHMHRIARYLTVDAPPRFPDHFEIAWILGQSKGLVIDRRALSPRLYLRDNKPTWSWGTIDEICIRQSLGIALRLRGITDDARLRSFDSDPKDEMMRGLQTLIALRFGNKNAELRTREIRESVGQGFTDYPTEAVRDRFEPGRREPLPALFPIRTQIDRHEAIAVILGLIDTVVEASIRQQKGQLPKARKTIYSLTLLLRDLQDKIEKR